MQVTYHKWHSYFLNREMEYKVYGHKGKPVLVFPTSCGRFYQYEESGMIDALHNFIEEGKIQIWACDGIDWETFFSEHWNADDKISRHEQYDKYITQELIPSILYTSKENNNGWDQKILVTGCSMGAYHGANFFFRHPEFFDGIIALSGVYSTDYFFGDYKSTPVYLNSPVHYLRNLNDGYFLDKYRQSRIIICCGQGAYEDLMISDTHRLSGVLNEKSIPARIDFWGHDVSHDWPWWQKQIVHYLSQCV
jgi:esterase/lipase superfamily enzyme